MMADEATVIEAAQRLLRAAGLTDRSQLLVGRWIEDGLPSEPVDGLAGRDQLGHAVGVLLELSADVQSLAILGRAFPDRRVVFSAASRELGDSQRTVAGPLRPAVLSVSARTGRALPRWVSLGRVRSRRDRPAPDGPRRPPRGRWYHARRPDRDRDPGPTRRSARTRRFFAEFDHWDADGVRFVFSYGTGTAGHAAGNAPTRSAMTLSPRSSRSSPRSIPVSPRRPRRPRSRPPSSEPDTSTSWPWSSKRHPHCSPVTVPTPRSRWSCD